MKIRVHVLALVIAASGAARLSAHHSLTAIYDTGKVVSLTGVIAGVEIANPHVKVILNAKDSSGTVTAWTIELAPNHALRRRGFEAQSLTPGQQITIESWLRKDGTREATGRTLVTADGKRVDVGDSLNWGATPSR